MRNAPSVTGSSSPFVHFPANTPLDGRFALPPNPTPPPFSLRASFRAASIMGWESQTLIYPR